MKSHNIWSYFSWMPSFYHSINYFLGSHWALCPHWSAMVTKGSSMETKLAMCIQKKKKHWIFFMWLTGTVILAGSTVLPSPLLTYGRLKDLMLEGVDYMGLDDVNQSHLGLKHRRGWESTLEWNGHCYFVHMCLPVSIRVCAGLCACAYLHEAGEQTWSLPVLC